MASKGTFGIVCGSAFEVKTGAGIIERGILKPSTVHQEFRVLEEDPERGSSQEAPAVQSVFRGRVPCRGAGPVPAPLRFLVGTVAD